MTLKDIYKKTIPLYLLFYRIKLHHGVLNTITLRYMYTNRNMKVLIDCLKDAISVVFIGTAMKARENDSTIPADYSFSAGEQVI